MNAQKAGHGGTLDPLASGILPIALGEATKTVNFIQDAIKTYEFEVTWGEQRSTDDAEGEIIQSSDARPSLDDINGLLGEFIGDVEQMPPQFSAVKIDGERAYDIARDGEVADIKSRQVYIESLEIIERQDNSEPPRACTVEGQKMSKTSFKCVCGKGTYIRSIARDLGGKLGCFGYISALKRTQVGVFTLDDAISLDFFLEMIDKPDQERNSDDFLLPLQTVLGDIPALALKEEEKVRLKNGNELTFLSKPDLARLDDAKIDWKADETTIALATYEDIAIAMVEIYGAKIQPVRVFNL
jgi:tRNA pseudouridine55 synthase